MKKTKKIIITVALALVVLLIIEHFSVNNSLSSNTEHTINVIVVDTKKAN